MPGFGIDVPPYTLSGISPVFQSIEKRSCANAVSASKQVILHVIFEFLMVPFSMLDVQREIRDEMKTLNQQLAELHVKQNTAETGEKSPSDGEKK